MLHGDASLPELCLADERVHEHGFAVLVVQLLRLLEHCGHVVSAAQGQALRAEAFHNAVVFGVLEPDVIIK